MSKNRKYSTRVEQKNSSWRAQIRRQVTSTKVVVSKQQTGFNSEADAMAWAEQQLEVFSNTLSESNKRHNEQRKENSEERLQRSERRSEKTQHTKEAATRTTDGAKESG